MNDVQDLLAPGESYKEIYYNETLDWLIQFRSLEHCWKYQPTYLLSQTVFIIGGILTFTHALLKKGRLTYLWIGILLHGFVVESMCYALPDIDNFWHSQTPIMFLGQRLPLHILFLYPCFIYNATVAVSKMKLPHWAEPFAVGLCTVLIDIPYDIVSVNYLHWTWHDTDPNIADRHYNVPWNSYYFHACFAAGFTFWFRFTRNKISDESGWKADVFWKEAFCTVVAALLGTPTGILFFVPIYHPLHDVYKIHSEVTFFIIFAIFLLIIWTGDRTARRNFNVSNTCNVGWSTWLLIMHLVLHYACFMCILLFFKSEDEVAIGLKEPIGPCENIVKLQSASGMVLEKKEFLCLQDYDENYFDWHCLRLKPQPYSIWYTACGTKLDNKVEFITIISLICTVATVVFANLHFNSFGDQVFNTKKVKKQKQR